MADDNKDTDTYVIRRGTHNDKTAGDEVELTEEERATFDPQGVKFVPAEETDPDGVDVESDGESGGGERVEETSVEPPFDPSEENVGEFKSKVENEGYDAPELRALYDAEENAEGRKGVKEFLDEKLNEE